MLEPEREVGSRGKKLKGLGIGSPDGPVLLDDVWRLEKSNAVSCFVKDGNSLCRSSSVLTLLA
jgi:hypothetical protein